MAKSATFQQTLRIAFQSWFVYRDADFEERDNFKTGVALLSTLIPALIKESKRDFEARFPEKCVKRERSPAPEPPKKYADEYEPWNFEDIIYVVDGRRRRANQYLHLSKAARLDEQAKTTVTSPIPNKSKTYTPIIDIQTVSPALDGYDASDEKPVDFWNLEATPVNISPARNRMIPCRTSKRSTNELFKPLPTSRERCKPNSEFQIVDMDADEHSEEEGDKSEKKRDRRGIN